MNMLVYRANRFSPLLFRIERWGGDPGSSGEGGHNVITSALIKGGRGFPGGPVATIPSSQCRKSGFDPSSGS